MPIIVPILLISAVILSSYSVKDYNLNGALIGTVFAFPAVYYLAGAPVFSGFVIFVPLFQLASAYFIYKKNRKLAWLMLIPLYAVFIWMMVLYFI